MSTLRSPHCEHTSRSRQSSSGLGAVAFGHLGGDRVRPDAGIPCTNRSAALGRRLPSVIGGPLYFSGIIWPA